MLRNGRRYLSVEAPDTAVTIDYLGRFGCTVKVDIGTNDDGEPEIRVQVIGADDRNTILLDECRTLPEAIADDDGDDDEEPGDPAGFTGHGPECR